MKGFIPPLKVLVGGFTLIEVLIVIAIIGILGAVLVVVMNPTELLRQSRDSSRLSDLNTLNKSLTLFEFDQTSGFMGTSSVVYVSIPDSSATCANLGLPGLPSGWSYNCVTSDNLKKVGGNGWVPVNFTSMSFPSPLARLPVDPTNTTSSQNYYTYVAGGSFKIATKLQSEKYINKAAIDGGIDPATYEAGSDLALAPFTHGLIGYWKFDESSGETASDSSGYARNGTLTNGPTWAAGKYGGGLTLDGSNDYLQLSEITGVKGISMWVNISTSQGADWRYLADARTGLSNGYFANNGIGADWTGLYVNGSSVSVNWSSIPKGSWIHLYLVPSASFTDNIALMARYTGVDTLAADLDEVRIYTRALSASEILAIYNATN